MKKACLIASLFAVLSAFGADSLEFVSARSDPSAGGIDYLKVNEDLSSFTISSTFGSIGKSARVGYYTYEGTLTQREREEKIAASRQAGQYNTRADGGITVRNVSAGQKIGFYLEQGKGFGYGSKVVKDWNIVRTKNGYLGIEFTQRGIRDEFMLLGDIVVVSRGSESKMAGTPLPGFLPALLVGSIGLAGAGWRRFRGAA